MNICEHDDMKQAVLITGICGFVGCHMSKYLINLSEKLKIIGIDIADEKPVNCHIYYKYDLSSSQNIENIIKEAKPDIVMHLVGTFEKNNLLQIYRTNVLSLVSLLDSVSKYVPKAVTIVVGSTAEYGFIEPEKLPVVENATCLPVTHYGLSKYLATQIALYYYSIHNLCTMVVRPFQLIGKKLNPRLAPGAFAEQLRQAAIGKLKTIKTGNLDSQRDFLDIRDAVEGIWMLCQYPSPGKIFNLCSGKATKMHDLLMLMIALTGVDVNIQTDPCCLKDSIDVSSMYGCYNKIYKHCGWQPKRSLAESIKTMLD